MRKLFLAAYFAVAAGSCGPAFSTDYSIMAPAMQGSGWDQTARTVQSILEELGISKKVRVYNVPGAGGTIGLAQFIHQSRGNPTALLMSGNVMIGTILTDHPSVTLADVTPIARITGEAIAIVVPANSPIKTMADLVAKLKADPSSVLWGGGYAGGTDQITARLIAKAVGVDPTKVNYIASHGGGEATEAVINGRVTVGISSIGEFTIPLSKGTLRLLAVSSDKRVLWVNAPTLREVGIDVAIENWRMIVAAPGITAEQKAAISADIHQLATSQPWKEILAKRNWFDNYLAGEEFDKQLKADIAATSKTLKDIGLLK